MSSLRIERFAAIFLLGSLVACSSESGTSSTGNGAGGTTGGNAGAGTGSAGNGSGSTGNGTGGAGTAPSTLAGTWEVIESGDTEPMGVITLGKDELVLAFGDSRLSYRAENGALTVSYREDATETPVAATRQTIALDTGALALDLGGTWSFTASDGSGEACSAEVDLGSFTTSCSGVTPPRPVPSANGTVTGTRTETRPSIFGELGGLWTVTTEDGSCTAELVDNKFTSTCDGSDVDGSVEIVFTGDLASGHASDAIEFSAHRVQ